MNQTGPGEVEGRGAGPAARQRQRRPLGWPAQLDQLEKPDAARSNSIGPNQHQPDPTRPSGTRMNEVTLVADVADVGQVAPASASGSDRQQHAKSSGPASRTVNGRPPRDERPSRANRESGRRSSCEIPAMNPENRWGWEDFKFCTRSVFCMYFGFSDYMNMLGAFVFVRLLANKYLFLILSSSILNLAITNDNIIFLN